VILDFHFDFSSPFAYLAATQVEAVAARHGAQVRWSPLLLGGLFRDLGGVDVPLFAMPPPKRAFIEADLQAWASWWGVPLRWPERFPVRSVLALRTTLAHPEPEAYARRVFHAAWGEGRDIADPAVLVGCGADESVLAAAPTMRDALRARTDAARARGIFGVPTFVVDDRILLWGQDRVPMLEAILSGWNPPATVAPRPPRGPR
jgi:2-hydroxychromene-2-carboxylate isomerase